VGLRSLRRRRGSKLWAATRGRPASTVDLHHPTGVHHVHRLARTALDNLDYLGQMTANNRLISICSYMLAHPEDRIESCLVLSTCPKRMSLALTGPTRACLMGVVVTCACHTSHSRGHTRHAMRARTVCCLALDQHFAQAQGTLLSVSTHLQQCLPATLTGPSIPRVLPLANAVGCSHIYLSCHFTSQTYPPNVPKAPPNQHGLCAVSATP
jgi:hypothetical protein